MKPASILGWSVLGLTLLASGAYVFRYLYAWEWHRAILTIGLFLAAEVAFATALVLRKLRRNAHSARQPAADPTVLAHIRDAAPQRDHFAWLKARNGQLNVFITILLGGGVVVSGIAWVVERLAQHTGAAGMERDLASRLSAITLPPDGLVVDDAELLAQEGPYSNDARLRLLLGPTRRPQ